MICVVCGNEFHRVRSAKTCSPECSKKRQNQKKKEWEAKHPDVVKAVRRESNRRWRINHPEQAREIERRWAKQNREQRRQYNREWQRKNYKRVKKRRLKYREADIMALGGKCQKCGYNKCIAALEIHDHKTDHPQLLCSNCHRELHFN